ncbi:MAG TPA: chromosomal replication initiator protein DnaA [Methylomirabilota bacterium]|jgi:chromosomal replication initiator protein|nr:chromosomal replication initiator protein DnaA [Methylomirabilota bacterium]
MQDRLWERLLAALEGKLPSQALDTWIRPGRLLAHRDSHLEIGVPSKFIRTYLLEHYLAELQGAAQACLGPRATLTVSVDRAAAPPSETPPPTPPAGPPPAVLDSRYTFDTFVVGSSNQFAQAACLAVAELPSRAYNPLFIYGGVGLGKTHLLHAIGHQIGRAQPPLRVEYLSTEKFTNELIGAIRYDKTPDFRHRYRTIDVLLIDDIQFISGKERTQEELFHTFNDLHEAGRQIVFSSDRSPKEIPDIEERLRSRFEWGLIADIQPPDFETRVAILKKKAELDRVPLADDLAFFMASKVKSNIRELEGSLVRIRAFCNLTGREMNLDLAQEVLANIWGTEDRLITLDEVQRRVGEVFGVKPLDLRSKTRTKAVAFPRQVAMYIARQLTSDSFADIGRGFGGKDHTTVLHAVNKIEALLQEDPKFRKTIDHIINTIRIE